MNRRQENLSYKNLGVLVLKKRCLRENMIDASKIRHGSSPALTTLVSGIMVCYLEQPKGNPSSYGAQLLESPPQDLSMKVPP